MQNNSSYRYAQREQAFRPSPIRAVFETAMRPDVISLAGGNPDLSFLPHAEIAQLSQKLLTDQGETILQYGSGAGTDACRELSTALMDWSGAKYQVNNIQITSGSQAGLDAVTKLFCDPGDVILAEAPTYVGALCTFEAYQVELRQIPIDQEGLPPQQVEEYIKQAQSEGKTVRFLYTIPAYQNPSGICLSTRRQEQLIEVCAKYGVLIIEDDAYGLLGFPNDSNSDDNRLLLPGNRPKRPEAVATLSEHSLPGGASVLPRHRSLAAVSSEQVIHLGSYSKIFSPGARVGWIAAPETVRARLQIGCESVCITPSVLAQTLVENYVGTPLWRKCLTRQVSEYQRRAQATIKAVKSLLPPGTSWVEPEGGFFLWLELPKDLAEIIQTQQIDLLQSAVKQKLVLIPGSGCYLGKEPGCHLRLAFSAVEPKQIESGVERLAACLAQITQATNAIS